MPSRSLPAGHSIGGWSGALLGTGKTLASRLRNETPGAAFSGDCKGVGCARFGECCLSCHDICPKANGTEV